MKFRLSQIFAMICLIGCTSASKNVQIPDLDRSLNDIRKSVVTVIGDPRVLSENQREYYSTYFSRVPSDTFDPNKASERLTAIISILGDRRPYTIDVKVVIEKKTAKGYQDVGRDRELALQIRKDIREKLAQGQDGVNVIDDFRAF